MGGEVERRTPICIAGIGELAIAEQVNKERVPAALSRHVERRAPAGTSIHQRGVSPEQKHGGIPFLIPIFAAVAESQVQGREPLRRSKRAIGTMGEELAEKLNAVVASRVRERRVTRCILSIELHPAAEQKAGNLHVPVDGCNMQRREPICGKNFVLSL